MLVLADPVYTSQRKRIVDLAVRARLPLAAYFRSFAEAGALVSYGPDTTEIFRRLAVYTDKILKGTKPADFPVEEPTKYELIINLKTAKALGLTIPQSVVLRADEIIQ
jgi:putative ABC transport system substrate-binding protein